MTFHPAITAEDIKWAAKLLNLQEQAFLGPGGTDLRADVLKTDTSIDIAACPGSGKTTLLVAKLAILANKWEHSTQGICVLSHTNAARHEIESRLGHSTEGRRLLSYPHFIGTIHGFVDEFLALPWLRSQGFPIKMIDTELVCRRRWSALKHATRAGLEKQHHEQWIMSIKSPDFAIGDLRWGKKPVDRASATYKEIQEVCRTSAKEGYFCYDEMFVWAHDLLDKSPEAAGTIRSRFPLFFLDEAQDNGEGQSLLLHRIFIAGGSAVVRQRFGDENQAIYDSTDATGATTDPFPITAIKKNIPDTHRFGPKIAKLADPLGLVPSGLVGQGPRKALASGPAEGRHTLFLFDPAAIGSVLKRYGDLLIDTFDADELKAGTFVAVGHVHKPKEEGKVPHHTGHYWPEYNPGLSRMDPKPKTLAGYVHVAQSKSAASGEVGVAVEKSGEGILRLARMLDAGDPVGHPRQIHRFILERLEGSAELQGVYQEFVKTFAIDREPLTETLWTSRWKNELRRIGEAIGGNPVALGGQDAQDFLKWSEDPAQGAQPIPVKSNDNFYRHSQGAKDVAIRVGSIHSVKGETHTATLVLETYWYDYNLEDLLPWLTGANSGVGAAKARQQSRLKLHYVAMSRPTHLLCLALKKDSFHNGTGQLDQALIDKAKQHGWHVEMVN